MSSICLGFMVPKLKLTQWALMPQCLVRGNRGKEVLCQAKNIHKQRAKTSGKLAMRQISSGNPYSIESIQEEITFYFHLLPIQHS